VVENGAGALTLAAGAAPEREAAEEIGELEAAEGGRLTPHAVEAEIVILPPTVRVLQDCPGFIQPLEFRSCTRITGMLVGMAFHRTFLVRSPDF
jgi:hypothetical protein